MVNPGLALFSSLSYPASLSSGGIANIMVPKLKSNIVMNILEVCIPTVRFAFLLCRDQDTGWECLSGLPVATGKSLLVPQVSDSLDNCLKGALALLGNSQHFAIDPTLSQPFCGSTHYNSLKFPSHQQA